MAEIVNKRPKLKSLDLEPISKPMADGRSTKPVKRMHSEQWPAEGPHARGDLINEAATPGTGLFSSRSAGSSDVDPGAG